MPECTGNMIQCDKKKCKKWYFRKCISNVSISKNGIVVIVRLDHIPNAIYCYLFYKYCYLHCKYVDMYIVQ